MKFFQSVKYNIKKLISPGPALPDLVTKLQNDGNFNDELKKAYAVHYNSKSSTHFGLGVVSAFSLVIPLVIYFQDEFDVSGKLGWVSLALVLFATYNFVKALQFEKYGEYFKKINSTKEK